MSAAMGSGHSGQATQYQNAGAAGDVDDDLDEEHHISISNKMVERLVEDATLAGGAAATSGAATKTRGDFKDKMYMEKLKCMDENHSERCGITVDEIRSTAARIEMRTANMINPEPVCDECKEQVIDCYAASQSPADIVKCWDTVGAFSKCVQDAAANRLRARTQKDARDYARRSRHVAHAREHALKDLAPRETSVTS